MYSSTVLKQETVTSHKRIANTQSRFNWTPQMRICSVMQEVAKHGNDTLHRQYLPHWNIKTTVCTDVIYSLNNNKFSQNNVCDHPWFYNTLYMNVWLFLFDIMLQNFVTKTLLRPYSCIASMMFILKIQYNRTIHTC